LVRLAEGISILPSTCRASDSWGARRTEEEGASLTRIAGPAIGRQALRSWVAGPRTLIVFASTILGATVGGYPRAASQAERGGGDELRCSSPGQACPVRETVSLVRSGSQPVLARTRGLSRKPDVRAREGPLGKRGRRKSAGGNTLPPMRARIGRSRSCSRVVECRCRSRQQMFWRREAGVSISTDLEASGDGRLVPYRPRASVNDKGAKRHRCRINAEAVT